MTVRTFSLTHAGLQPQRVEVEVDTVFGKPQLVLIGLPEKTLVEAKERITASLSSCGVRIRAQRTVVNLAPADHRKNGSSLELAIAVSLLKLYSLVPPDTDDAIFLGELSLDGTLKSLPGCLVLCQAAAQMGFSQVFVPKSNAREAALVAGINVRPLSHLREYLDHYQRGSDLPTYSGQAIATLLQQSILMERCPDFASIAGQAIAKRALEVAAAGGHHTLLIGPPGIGKTMLAQAVAGILPSLTATEALEMLSLHSLVGNTDGLLNTLARPFRAPHHSSRASALIGGGRYMRPGEISLAHTGILFLDELPEFDRDALESLRQPLEEGSITISRAHETYHFPARCTLIAAANPCPCGYFRSTVKACSCSKSSRDRYQARCSGPLLDRIDISVGVEAVQPTQLQLAGETSAVIRQRVQRAREAQRERFQDATSSNRSLQLRDVERRKLLQPTVKQYLNQSASRLECSTRAYVSCIRVAQTLSDLAGTAHITKQHIAEALQLRFSG